MGGKLRKEKSTRSIRRQQGGANQYLSVVTTIQEKAVIQRQIMNHVHV